MSTATISPLELAALCRNGEPLELIDVRTPAEFGEVLRDECGPPHHGKRRGRGYEPAAHRACSHRAWLSAVATGTGAGSEK